MGSVYQNIPDDYISRCTWLLRQGIAIWDVLAAAERKGSLDSNIRNQSPNNFPGFFQRYPSIRLVCFNGAQAQKDYDKLVGISAGKEFRLLPSSSGALPIRFDQKCVQWKELLRI